MDGKSTSSSAAPSTVTVPQAGPAPQGNAPMSPRRSSSRASPGTSSRQIRFRVRGQTLIVPPFRITRFGQSFTSPKQIEIDLSAVQPGAYRVIAVHNFQVEDRNPDLSECAAGVFLAARRLDGRWTEPETFPIECRTLVVVGEIQVPARPQPVGGES